MCRLIHRQGRLASHQGLMVAEVPSCELSIRIITRLISSPKPPTRTGRFHAAAVIGYCHQTSLVADFFFTAKEYSVKLTT